MSVKLKKWPFAPGVQETVLWITSPKMDVKKKWYFDVVFKNQEGGRDTVRYPWGLFSHFKLGDIFIDGSKSIRVPTLIKRDISIDVSKGEICDAVKIPKWIYPIEDGRCLKEKCIYYKNANQEVYIPCFEVVRSLFCKTAFLSKALLTPQGLKNLINEYEEIDDQTVSINLSNNFPSSLLKKEVVRHFAWLYFDEKVRNTWEFVSQNAYKSVNLGGDVLLSLQMPFDGKINISALVVEQDSYYSPKYKCDVPTRTVVMEILSVNNIKPRYKYVEYDHMSIFKSKPGDPSGKKSSGVEEEPWSEEEYFLGEEESKPNVNDNKQILQSFFPIVNFDNEIDVRRIPSRSKKQNTNGNEESSTTKSVQVDSGEDINEGDKTELGVNGADADSESENIEFIPINANADVVLDGLENFHKALFELKKNIKDVKVNWDRFEVPIVKDRSYCYINGVQVRRFILAKIMPIGTRTQYILEVGNPDRENIYTLLFYYRVGTLSDSKLNSLVKDLLVGLIDNNGHWDEEIIGVHGDLYIDVLKHYKKHKNPAKLANYLREKIYIKPIKV
ncbi:hypothetical protein [Pelosinus propionicus]|uniref:TnsE C-terminal domain-containing protein n=1 Tax=Pelosinus propionicus DSM 13327 TaxID=1123291 RepID=A0A1I4P8W5_9FIRM|nr:hypothetical protein [Pelosinus propionicus]SFM24065.1 hypothetical protein SAMN04490355_105927 [Pelosinus propionicus DSM 13327]